MRRLRTVNVARPAESAKHDGLAYTLWTPPQPATAGVVILHGAGSSKESHHDFARMLAATGLAALCFDQRGHGESGDALDARAGRDVARMADLLRNRLGTPDALVALRGSSMGGYLAIAAAEQAGARAVVAICPAPAQLLRTGLTRRGFGFEADVNGLDAFLAEHDLEAALDLLEVPTLLLHAEGDEQVPVESSRGLAGHFRSPDSRLVVVPGGHHRSIQHDPDLQALSLRFIERALS
ncbi:MAG TPA: alpha/beta fold hydrolase [Solirubrobacteraceae bacterium]|jgi:alpha-beta hydrolase superfamily lysophospholipase|nr:alpha/beta fold hydrolase [Solirubrobacteraceae bacterium]